MKYIISAKRASTRAYLRRDPEFQKLPGQMIEKEIFHRSL